MLPKIETKRRPRGPEEVRAALLRAARSEWSERGPDAPLRAVATRAEVNLGLIHHYVGNKDDLLRAVLSEDNELGAAVAARMGDVASSTRAMFLVGTAHPEHTRLSAWLALAGRSDFLVGEGPSMSDVIVAKHADNSGGPSEQMRAALALTIAAVHGWALFSQQIVDLLGGDAEEMRHAVGDLVGTLAPPHDSDADVAAGVRGDEPAGSDPPTPRARRRSG